MRVKEGRKEATILREEKGRKWLVGSPTHVSRLASRQSSSSSFSMYGGSGDFSKRKCTVHTRLMPSTSSFELAFESDLGVLDVEVLAGTGEVPFIFLFDIATVADGVGLIARHDLATKR
jgi:hypothetical protein